jgi:Flp pilus assembly protein TadD
MSRFGKLEFEPDHTGTTEQRPMAGEAHWYGEAGRSFHRGEFEPALRHFARVLEHNPENVAAWAGQVRALIELGEYREARLWSDKALERFPQSPELLAAKAVALARLGDLENAMAFSDASLEERGDTAYVWLARGDVLLARSERQVDHCFERARIASPGDWTVAWLGARIRHHYRQFAHALQLAREACSLAPGELAPWLLSGQCQLVLGFHDEARLSFTQAWQIRPDNVEAREGLEAAQRPGLASRIGGALRRLFRP